MIESPGHFAELSRKSSDLKRPGAIQRLDMHPSIVVGGVAALLFTGVHADLCSQGSEQIEGNVYCQPVEAIRYSNVGAAGSYNEITKMGSDGSCSSTPKHFSGPLAPLDEEVSEEDQ